MSRFRPFFPILILLTCLTCMGVTCGTNTGNPKSFFIADPSQADVVLDAICNKLSECFEVTFEDCSQGMLGNMSVDTEIGLNSEQTDLYTTYEDILNAEFDDEIEGNADRGERCSDDIEMLECGDSEVTDAYSDADPTNFENVTSLLSQATNSCKGIF